MGLRSMRERAEMGDGSLGVDSSPGTNIRVELRVPLDERLRRPSEGSSWSKVDTKVMLIPL